MKPDPSREMDEGSSLTVPSSCDAQWEEERLAGGIWALGVGRTLTWSYRGFGAAVPGKSVSSSKVGASLGLIMLREGSLFWPQLRGCGVSVFGSQVLTLQQKAGKKGRNSCSLKP